MLRAIAVPALLLLASCAAQPQAGTTDPRTAAWFLDVCRSTGADARAERAFCGSYLEGVAMALNHWEHEHPTGGKRHFCVPPSATPIKPDDLRHAFIAWAAPKKAALNARLYDVVYAFTEETFRC